MLLEGKQGLVLGVANRRSIAWAIAQAMRREGAQLAFSYQGERVKETVQGLASTLTDDPILLPWSLPIRLPVSTRSGERQFRKL